MSTIGLDIGTTGCKAIVFGDDGNILSHASWEYSILTPQTNWAEQDAELVWQLGCGAPSKAVAKNYKDPPKALALSVQGGRGQNPRVLGGMRASFRLDIGFDSPQGVTLYCSNSKNTFGCLVGMYF